MKPVIAAIFACLTGICLSSAAAVSGPPALGRPLPDIELPVPGDAAQRLYLGLSAGDGTFTIGQIRAQVVIIEIFSMYCPHCQREAPTVNDLFRKIEASPILKGKVKIIGIGAGNSLYEISFFKNKYAIPFPLFPDSKFAIHKKIGEVRTPYFIAVRIAPEGSQSVFFSRLGGAQDASIVLQDLIEKVLVP